MSELGQVFAKLAGAAKEALPKIFDNELSRVAVIRGENTVRKTGQFGDMLVEATKKWQDDSAKMSGQYYSEILKSVGPHLKDPKVTKDIATHWGNYKNLPDGTLKDTIGKMKVARLGMYDALQKAGVKVGKLEEDDFPRIYDRKLFEGVNRDAALKRLQTGGMSSRQAEGLLDQISGKSPKAHNYESPRKWDLPGYRRDLGVLFEDFDKGAKRLNFAKIFGANEENYDMLIQGIKSQSGREGQVYAQRYFDAIMKNGIYYKGAGKMEQGFASLQVATNLSLSVLSHTSQPLNLAVYGGRLKPVVKAMAELVSEFVDTGHVRSASDFALRAGATWTEAMHKSKELYGAEVGNLGGKLLQKTGFVGFDRGRRILASVAGKHLAEDLFQEIQEGVRPDVAKAKLGSMGIDVEKALKAGRLGEDDLLQAAKRTSDQTQFTFDANQLPTAWKSSPGARIALQFKQYFYVQANFIKDFALKPAFEYLQSGGASGEIKPLIYMSLLFPTFGEVTADLREYARKGTLEERPQYPLERVVDNMSHAGAFGLWQDLMYNIASPSDAPLWHFVTGPTLGEIVDLARLPHSHQPIGIEMMRHVPVVGPYASHSMREAARKRPRKKGMLERGVVSKTLGIE
jgi:hypothetical protein